MTAGEPDFTLRTKALVDHWYIKGVLLKDPTISESIPISIENPAIAYDAVNDRFKVDVEAWTVGTIPVDVSDDWTRQLGQIDLARVLGAALAHANPVITRLTNGSAFIDPRDVSDRATRLLGVVYGSQAQQLLQRATTYDLQVQLRHAGAEINPQTIRSLTKASDSVESALAPYSATLADNYPNAVRIISDKDGNPMTFVLYPYVFDGTTWDRMRGDSVGGLKVQQYEKDRTISDITKTTTTKQISVTHTGGDNQAIWTPAAGKKIRLKMISLELSANVDLGYRFGTTGNIYYLRTTAGPYVANFIGCADEGAVDAVLYLNASGACTVKGFAKGDEV